MKSEIKITDNANVCQIDIEGTIGLPEKWESYRPIERIKACKEFRDILDRIRSINAPEVVVNIRSTGGEVDDALLIYDALRSLRSRVTTRCYGYVASAATIIAQAASEGRREISDNSFYLIHTSTCEANGNAIELSAKSELLAKIDDRLVEIYANRSGLPARGFAVLMAENNGNGRWMSPQETVNCGLADTVGCTMDEHFCTSK